MLVEIRFRDGARGFADVVVPLFLAAVFGRRAVEDRDGNLPAAFADDWRFDLDVIHVEVARIVGEATTPRIVRTADIVSVEPAGDRDNRAWWRDKFNPHGRAIAPRAG